MGPDERWLQAAVDLAVANVPQGGGPFGAVVVHGGDLLATGQNRVTRDDDPTAHAEIVAIRAACAVRGDFALPGSVLYSSCEPCPMCVTAAMWARVDRIVYAANRADAARGGFDDQDFYELFGQDRSTWPVTVDEIRVPGTVSPFEAWMAEESRVPY